MPRLAEVGVPALNAAAACGASFLRGALIVAAALPAASWLCGLVSTLRGRQRVAASCLLLAPFLVPELLVAYAYANAPFDWRIQSPVLNELFYSLLLAMRVVPVGVAALFFAPPASLAREALHCRRLAFAPGTGRLRQTAVLAAYRLRGRAQALFPVAAIMFLLAFQDFELASRLEVNSVPAAWTVRVYDAHVGGLSAADSLRLSLLPVSIELAILIPVVLIVVKSWSLGAADDEADRQPPRWEQSAAWCYLLLAAVIVGGIPLVLVLKNAAAGFVVFAGDVVRKGELPLLKEILTSTAFALAGGLGASGGAMWVLGRLKRSQRPMAATLLSVLTSVPGLVGTLILSLAVLAAVQIPILSFFYRNSLPVPLERMVTSLPLITSAHFMAQ